ncbi:hypothetical protein BZA77DRAFT_287454 [Pyronema omphalodes]|nr:hypothetical protein BZA77DRAFT_287454 [Pyronema omphalodes]
MDPLSISAAVTGFASLAGQIISTLRDYVDGVKSAANEAQSLLQEVTAFRQVLEHFGGFILTNHLDKHEFQGSSALVEAIGACKNHLENLHRKLEDTSNTISNSRKSTGLVARIKWPFKKGELQETVGGLHRLANIFQLWMTMNTHELMSGTFSIVQSQLDKNWQNMESLVTDMKSLPIAMSSMLQQRMSEISQMKTLLLELSHSNLIEHRNFSRVMREVQERLQDDEIQKMMPWISTLQPHKRHQDIQQQRLEGTGGWFLLQPEFEKWRDDELAGDGNKSCVLACSGIPGAGKSVICSLVFDHLDEKFNFDTEENACVVCLYCDYGNEKNQTSVNMIGVLLKQVIARLNKSGSLPQHTISTLRKYLKEQKHVNLQDACQMLVETVKQLRKFYVCIDALDECNLHHRRELVQSLERISGECSRQTSVRIFFTARPHIGLRDMMKCNPGLGPVEYLYLRAQTDDIKKYVNSIIDEDDNGECMTNTLRSQILDRIVYNSDGM